MQVEDAPQGNFHLDLLVPFSRLMAGIHVTEYYHSIAWRLWIFGVFRMNIY